MKAAVYCKVPIFIGFRSGAQDWWGPEDGSLPQRAAVGHREWWPAAMNESREARRSGAAHGDQLSNCCRLMPSFLIRKRVVEGFRLSRRAAPAGPSMTPWVFFRMARIC